MAITIPNTFVAGTKIEASPMNANFAETANAVDKRGDTVTGNIAANAGVKFDGVDLSTIPNSSGTFDPLFAQVVIGTADTNGIRLDLETGTLAVREGDDSAYAPLISGLLTTSGNHVPASNDGGSLGISGTAWADLFLASGGVIDWNAGNTTLTQSAGKLTIAGSGAGALDVKGAVSPTANDGAALGSATVSWADLFLASGGVLNFNNGDVTVTHSSNTLAFAGASTGYTFADGPVTVALGAAGTPSLTFSGDLNTGFWSPTADTVAASTGGTERMRIDSSGNVGIAVTPSAWNSTSKVIQLGDGAHIQGRTGTPSFVEVSSNIYRDASANIIYLATAAAARYQQSSGAHYWFTIPSGTAGTTATSTERMRLTNDGNLQPGSNDGGQLGVSGTAWSDLFLASGGVINWNAGDTTLSHTAANTLTVTSAATALRYNVYSTSNSGAPKIAMLNGLNSCAISLLGDSSGTMVFSAGDATTERMRLTGAGLLGIGGTPDTYLLDVRGGVTSDIAIRGVTDSASNVESLRFFCQNTTEGGRISAVRTAASNAPNDLVFYTSVSGSVSECLRLTSGKDTIIPATSKFYLDGGGNTYISETSADVFRIYTGGVDRFALSTSQCYINVVYSQTTASAANVNVAADGLLARSTSSLRYKHDVDTLGADHALAAVMAMRPVTYRGKTDADQRKHVGFIAEEMAEIAPLLCTYDDGGESGTPNYVTYDRVTAYLVAVVQQQQTEIAALKARLN